MRESEGGRPAGPRRRALGSATGTAATAEPYAQRALKPLSGDRRTLVGPYRDAGDRRVLDFVPTLGTAGDRAGIGRLAHTL